MQIIFEPKFRYNARRLPPPPPRLGGLAVRVWATCWRTLHRSFRYQMSEDLRYWTALRETIGRAETEARLGPEDAFKIESLLHPKKLCDDPDDLL